MHDERLTLYLDTSIPSAYYDTSKPVRQLMTQKWFEQKAVLYRLHTSVTAIDEIDEFGNLTKRQQIKDLLLDYRPTILDVSPEAVSLAQEYMQQGAIPQSEPEDAYHIAIASVNRLDGLASWNFKHIVSMNPIRKIHEINMKHGYPILEIGSLELFGGAEYGNI
jgi:hypothetical protein